jgi:hypothetical protein
LILLFSNATHQICRERGSTRNFDRPAHRTSARDLCVSYERRDELRGALDEYEETARWLAQRCLTAAEGDPLPDAISETAEKLIDDDVRTFQDHVRAAAALLRLEDKRAREFDPALSRECAAIAEVDLPPFEAKGQEIAPSDLALPEIFSPAELEELEPASKPEEPIGADVQADAKAA